MKRQKVREQMSIAIVASFGKSSRCELRIAIAHTVGSTVTLTTLGSVTRDGMNFIPTHGLRKMLETNGQREIKEHMENGND